MPRIPSILLATAVALALCGCQGSASSPHASAAGATARPTATASIPALEGVDLANWVCDQNHQAVKHGTHGDPSVMRPIAEAAKRSGVDGFTFKGSVLLRMAEQVESDTTADLTLVMALQNNASELDWTCKGAVLRPGWPSSTPSATE
ncbi:hypothetical protein MRQ36_27835 [Micromonospora sp. R77]|uniref:hypothetical protein n=1 Tax=Micromonospora sp. R77 TaxID=2925836 RepID=UPI001F6018CA|nr:hypothetical protein [Micromonospora sp. R77]MCI4066153.1 hypothetical protein [Micromonospora sp. R77]